MTGEKNFRKMKAKICFIRKKGRLPAAVAAGILAGILCAGQPAQGLSRVQAAEPQETAGTEMEDFTLSEEEKELLEELKEKLDSGQLETEEQILAAIGEAEEKLGISLTQDQKDYMVRLAGQLNGMGLDSDQITDMARQIYEKYTDQIRESADAAIQENVVEPVKEAVVEGTKATLKDFFHEMGETLKNFFGRIFGR